MDAPHLVVTRASHRDLQQREIYVFLDGERIGVLSFGRKVRREVTPGPHQLKVYNTLFWKTAQFEAIPGATVAFETGNVPFGCLLSGLVIVGAGPMSVFLERTDGEAPPPVEPATPSAPVPRA